MVLRNSKEKKILRKLISVQLASWQIGSLTVDSVKLPSRHGSEIVFDFGTRCFSALAYQTEGSKVGHGS